MLPLQHFPVLGASACVFRAGKVLLVERAKPVAGIWALPGGRVEPGETPNEAASRELLEETGLRARLDAFVGLYDIIRRNSDGGLSMHYVIACYAGVSPEGAALPSSDALAVRWADPSALGGIALAPHVAVAITRARELLSL